MPSRDLRASKLQGAALLDSTDDPMSSMGNLMDVMLVFACGLMLALIANWNVDLTEVKTRLNATEIEPIEGELEEVSGGFAEEGRNYSELGTVYRDDETGQLYVVSPES